MPEHKAPMGHPFLLLQRFSREQYLRNGSIKIRGSFIGHEKEDNEEKARGKRLQPLPKERL